MLTVDSLTYTLPSSEEAVSLINEVSFSLPAGHFMAIVGPSGCGKTTLLKIIAGLQIETAGRLFWQGQDLAAEGDLTASELGYIPQFSIAHDPLTVEECVENAVLLRTTLQGVAVEQAADAALHVTGLSDLRDHRAAILSGGQKRRLGLAMEWVSHPSLLLADEVTSGLDPRSAAEIVLLLHDLSRHPGRSVVNVTHSLDSLELYDSVLVLTGGRLAYHGPPASLAHYFSVADPREIYPRLASRTPSEWHESWKKRSAFYYNQLNLPLPGASPPPALEGLSPHATLTSGSPAAASSSSPANHTGHALPDPAPSSPATGSGNPAPTPPVPATAAIFPEVLPEPGPEASSRLKSTAGGEAGSARRPEPLPSLFRQFQVLFSRRLTLFVRDRTQLLLHLALLFGFPLLVVLFATENLGALPENPGHSDLDLRETLTIQMRVVEQQSRLGGQISGLVMFQVILLTLIGANNGSREIAGERLIYEKERLAGLRPGAYLLSKGLFLGLLVCAQSLWMAFFVDHFADLPGPIMDQALLLLLVNGAMTASCLAISALLRSPEQASLLGIYLVGFQLPLSGAVLALPPSLEKFIQPLIAAYWSWSGQLATMRPTDYFVAINRAVTTPVITDPTLPVTVLGFHMAAGLILAWIGCLRHQWD